MKLLRLHFAFPALALSCSSNDEIHSPSARADAAIETGGSRGSTGGAALVGGSTGSGGAGGLGGTGGHAVRDSGVEGAAEGAADSSTESSAPDAGFRPKYLWQLPYGRSFAAHVAADSQGAAIVSGTFFEGHPVTLGTTTLTSRGSADIMLSRVLPTGTVDWARSYGALNEDYPVSFVLDANDRIDLSGLYNGTGNIGGPDFPAFAGTPGRFDVFVAGLDARGNYRWQSTVNTTSESFPGPGLAFGTSSLFVAGHFLGTAKINGVAHASAGSWDVYFARYDEPNGTVGAALTFGGTGDDRAVAAIVTTTDVVVFGSFHDQVSFPTSPPRVFTSTGGSDVFVARLTNDGVMTDVTAFGGAGDETVQGARLDADGSFVVAGDFSSPTLSIFGGKVLSNAGGTDVFVARLAADLSHLSSTSFGADGGDHVRDLSLGPGGEIAITGEFQNAIAFGPRTHYAARAADSGPTEIDMFLAKLSGSGDPIWSTSAGGPLPDRGLGVALDQSSAVYLTASFQSPIDFGGGDVLTPETGQWASALVKYGP